MNGCVFVFSGERVRARESTGERGKSAVAHSGAGHFRDAGAESAVRW